MEDWSGELLRTDGRWHYGVPPAGNANFAWLQHFIYHLSPQGQAGVVLAKGALTSKTSGEGEIRKALIEQGNVIDCIVNLPAKLFLNTQIPAALWFMRRGRTPSPALRAPSPTRGEGMLTAAAPSPLMGEGWGEGEAHFANRSNEILFIDARNLGHLINRRTKELSHADIKQITDTYHNWRNFPRHCEEQSDAAIQYQDIPGFCASVSIERVKELDYVLTPGRYVGLPDDEDDFNFAERFNGLKAEFEAQLIEEEKLNKAIAENLAKIVASIKP